MKLIEHLLDLGLAVLNDLVLCQVELADLHERFDDYVNVMLNDAFKVRRLFDH